MSAEQAFQAIFGGLDRQGPGSVASTRKALSLLPQLPEGGSVLDAGCGTGGSTLTLAQTLPRPIIASDVNAQSLQILSERVGKQVPEADVSVHQASMDDLGLEPDSLSLIWAEGAVFTVGPENALRHWYPLLKSGGVIAFSDLMWVSAERPEPAELFFNKCYEGLGAMPDVVGLLDLALSVGYRLHTCFTLPEGDWWDEYYAGLSARVEEYAGSEDPDIQGVVAHCRTEMDIVRQYLGSFGYVFFILVKP